MFIFIMFSDSPPQKKNPNYRRCFGICVVFCIINVWCASSAEWGFCKITKNLQTISLTDSLTDTKNTKILQKQYPPPQVQ